MNEIIKKLFDKARPVRSIWRRSKLICSGLLYLFIAIMLAMCTISFGESDHTEGMDFTALPNYDYIGEVKKLKETNKEEAKLLAQYIFQTEGLPSQDEARRIFEEIEKEQKDWWNRTKRAASGFITGDGGSIEELGGSVVSDMILYGDVRDLIKHSYFKVTKNEKGDAFIITLSAFGIATEFVDVVDWAPAVLKAFRKVGALSAKMVGLLSDGMKRCIRTRRVDSGLVSFFSGIKSMTDSLGFARASILMRHADTTADVATLAKAAKAAPNETYLLMKYSGKEGVRTLENLTEVQIEILREAAKKGPPALASVKKYMKAMKSRTSTARWLARFVKSLQSGHLTGFIHRVLLSIPFLRFGVVVLALFLALVSWRKFRLALKR